MISTIINKNLTKISLPLYQIPWDTTPNFRNGLFATRTNIDHIAGDNVFGKGKSRADTGIKSITSYLKRSAQMDIFKCVEGGTIVITPPTKEELVAKLQGLGTRALEYYSNLSYEQTDVTDHWAKAARVRNGAPLDISVPLHKRVLARGGKRFSAKVVTAKYTVIDMIKNSRGMLAEGHVVAFLNSGLKCPECKSIGKIGWCDGVSHRSVDAFRDAVCMNCHNNGVITLFEIKTRWENVVTSGGNGTYAGSFVALNTLMTLNANIYLVVASRDTGDVRIGKITSAKMRGNHNWLYALQEGLHWGAPSSYVTCAGGLMKCPVKMPLLIETMSDSFVDEITVTVLEGIKGLEN
jgi:hypothetical protein